MVGHRSQEDWAKFKIEEMSREELMPLMVELAGEMDSIRLQLEDARAKAASGAGYSDRDWYRRAQTALRARGRLHQRMQTRLSLLKKQERASNLKQSQETAPFERQFMWTAKELLPAETYERIMQVTQGRMADDHSA